MNTERTPLNDKELWRSLAAARDDAPQAVSDLDFAAWLEGRLSETAAARGFRPGLWRRQQRVMPLAMRWRPASSLNPRAELC